jgi:hypothetical protein
MKIGKMAALAFMSIGRFALPSAPIVILTVMCKIKFLKNNGLSPI